MSEPVTKQVLKKENEDHREYDIIEHTDEDTEDSSEEDIYPEVIKKIKETPILKLKPHLAKIHRNTVIRKRPTNYSGLDSNTVVAYTPCPAVGTPSTSGVSLDTPKNPYFTHARGLPREFMMPCPNVVFKPEMNEDSGHINTMIAGKT
uniref:Uncharacterized protein n=1 Tax=Timema poppense TaxID=170557 RepID=A0A7R9DBK3_TIMPO|nr:unnamed protein product [Timema poppensis]